MKLQSMPEKQFQNRFIIDLKSGYDMPIDSLAQSGLMPSVYCQISVGIKNRDEFQVGFIQSSTCVKQRHPIWNEQMVYKMSDA